MCRAAPKPAPPTVAVAISGTTRCADVSDLLLWQITHSAWPIRKDFDGKSQWNFTCGSQHDPLAMGAWGLNSKRKLFFWSVFGLGWGRCGCAPVNHPYTANTAALSVCAHTLPGSSMHDSLSPGFRITRHGNIWRRGQHGRTFRVIV